MKTLACNGPLLNYLTFVIYFCYCFYNGLPIFAQTNSHPSFRQYSTNDGLASSEVYQILQDNNGLIWLATDNGVSRFDGYEFKNFSVKDGLVENVIFMMQLDSIGRLWMQSMSGKLYYNSGDSIKPYKHNKLLDNYKNRLDTGKGFIVEGMGQVIHISMNPYGIITILEDGTFRDQNSDLNQDSYAWVLEKDNIAINSIYYNEAEITGKANDKKETTSLHYSVYFDTENGKWLFENLSNNPNKRKVFSTAGFLLDTTQYLFQFMDNIYLFDRGHMVWKHSFPYKILYAKMMEDGKIYIGLTFHNGLRVYDSIEDLKIEKYTSWLNGKTVSHFIKDKEGGKWFATNENGVFYAPKDAFMTIDQESGLSDEKVMTVSVNKDEIFLGLGNGQVWAFNRSNNSLNKISNFSSDDVVKDLHFEPRTNNLLVSRELLYHYNNNYWKSSDLKAPHRISSSNKSHSMWISSAWGFAQVKLKNNEHLGLDNYRGQRTYAVREDFEGNVWVGQSEGLFEWKNDSLIGQQNKHQAFSLRVEDVGLLPDSSLVVATKGGGIIFWKGDKFEQITTEQNLTADMLECLHVDINGNVWAGTLNGLNKISGTFGNHSVEQFTIYHGLPSNEINDIDSYNNDIWAATSKGLVHVIEKNEKLNSLPPTINSFKANNNNIDITHPIEIASKHNNLNINYTTINYNLNGQVLYRYRINKNPWSTTKNRISNFSSLNSGHHIFEVLSQNEDGKWSESSSLEFVINPVWYKTWWFRTAFISMCFLGGILYYKLRTQQIKKTYNTQLKIKELEQAAFQAQMNPHFIFNCLNSIQNNILQDEKETAIDYLGKFASLTRSVLNASVAGKIPITEEIKLLTNYLELENLRFKNRFTYSINTSEGLETYDIEIPPLLIQPYVENALKHGIASKSGQGKIDIYFSQENNFIQVTIIDNGSGIKNSDEISNKENGHKSFGMSITQNRLDLLSNDFEKNNVNVSNVYNESGEVSGTKIVIQIKLEH